MGEPTNDMIDLGRNSNSRECRRHFVGGSDARIIMSTDEVALIRLWREKRGELDPVDLSDNLVVQLGLITETLNKAWYERNTGHTIVDVQKRVKHPIHHWMAATLDGRVVETEAVFESKFMLPWSFSEEAAALKYMAQLQHNMWVTNTKSAVLSIITGGGKWVEITVLADVLYQHFLVTSERRFWRCVLTGELPRPYGIEPPKPKVEAVRTVDMGDFEFLGGIRHPLLLDTGGVSRTRTSQGRTKGLDAGGREGGVRPRRSSKKIEIRSD